MESVTKIEAKLEKQLEASAERVMDGEVDSTDNKTRSSPPLSSLFLSVPG